MKRTIGATQWGDWCDAMGQRAAVEAMLLRLNLSYVVQPLIHCTGIAFPQLDATYLTPYQLSPKEIVAQDNAKGSRRGGLGCGQLARKLPTLNRPPNYLIISTWLA